MSEISDALLDSASIVEFISMCDLASAELVLDTGDPRRMVMVLGGWVASALAHRTADERQAVIAGWRAMGTDRAGGWHDYDHPGD